jgi:hypothetical protein
MTNDLAVQRTRARVSFAHALRTPMVCGLPEEMLAGSPNFVQSRGRIRTLTRLGIGV